MSDSLYKKAFDACNAPYTPENADIAFQAVQVWLAPGNSNKVDEYTSSTPSILLFAIENGYPKVVQQLLKDEDLLEVEVEDRAAELFRKEQNMKGGVASGFANARKELKKQLTPGVKAKKSAAEPEVPKDHKWKRSQVMEQARYKTCYDMITLYMYIGEAIPDVRTLIDVISKLRDLGWMSMDDITDHWDKVRDELREKKKMEPLFLDQLSEARYNYDGWWHKHKQFNDEDTASESFCCHGFCSTLGSFVYVTIPSLIVVTIPSLIVLVPILVLVLLYDLVHYDDRLWLECFAWLGVFGLVQIFYALLRAPFTGWGMIKEASGDTDFGATLKGSMNMQGLVSTFLFSTIMGRLQVGLNFDLTNNADNATQVSSLEMALMNSGLKSELLFLQDHTEQVLQQWCAICACDL